LSDARAKHRGLSDITASSLSDIDKRHHWASEGHVSACGAVANRRCPKPDNVTHFHLRFIHAGKLRTCLRAARCRSSIASRPGCSRWMVPPAALCVHLCIGQAYAFSVFNRAARVGSAMLHSSDCLEHFSASQARCRQELASLLG
jgi:hypothetical protein